MCFLLLFLLKGGHYSKLLLGDGTGVLFWRATETSFGFQLKQESDMEASSLSDGLSPGHLAVRNWIGSKVFGSDCKSVLPVPVHLISSA